MRLLNSPIKEWYVETTPTDTFAKQYLKDGATFLGLFQALVANENIYPYILKNGEADSFIREKIFAQLAEIIGVEYDFIYDLWIGK